MLSTGSPSSSCLTGNPIDDCWKCDPNWANNRQNLANCAIGFGSHAVGGKGGQFYVVTDSSDHDAANPTPGTLRHAVIQTDPLWIVFSSNMLITLKHELIVNSYKTIDGRGVHVRITGGGCITLQYISNVIIHNIEVTHCVPSGNTNVRSSPTHVGWRGKSDGDGISIFNSRDLWIDHCSLSYCADGLIDAIMGSTGITISNSYFSHHDEVMLLGHDDKYLPDSGMQVTIAFNHFGEKLVQRMPRCRRGYIHVVNNDFTEWQMYAIGGSANPTINSQGNRYTAPVDPNAKEVWEPYNGGRKGCDEARGHGRGPVVGLELENGRGHNGKWGILRAIWSRAKRPVLKGLQCRAQGRCAREPAYNQRWRLRSGQVINPLATKLFLHCTFM
ncbi:hypothetical protein C3L33_03907, partial [Rhododendron williamsianum]